MAVKFLFDPTYLHLHGEAKRQPDTDPCADLCSRSRWIAIRLPSTQLECDETAKVISESMDFVESPLASFSLQRVREHARPRLWIIQLLW